MCIALRSCLAIATLVPCLASAGTQEGFVNFITRKGNRLMDGDREYRFMGANMPGMMLPYDFTLFLPERMHLPTPWEQEDAFKTLDQMNCRVVRMWNLPIRGPKEEDKPWHYVLGPGKFKDENFRVLDSMLALANKYGVRVIFPFTAQGGDMLGGIGTYAAHRGKKRDAFYTDPQIREDYKETVRYIITRTNSITGVPYREDKAVLAWQFGNEMSGAPDEWISEMAAFIKSLDPNHLVAETRHQPGRPMAIDPNIDMVTRHLYPDYRGIKGGWSAAIARELTAVKDQRPLLIGEYGPYIDGKMFTHGNVVGKVKEFLDYVQSEPAICGALLWSMYFHNQNGGFYWHQIMTYPAVWSYHWPGFPSAEAQREAGILQAVREAAFRIEGRPLQPVPAPDAPELLPVTGDVPFLTWRGSAGADGYDIERATQADGAWTTIAQNVSDADVAYRPLFSDTTAVAGTDYFYRVTARNPSGVSAPSNIAGPVQVRRICIVDELQDLSRTEAQSAGLKLNNDYNALYAEYLFRAKGDTNDWVTYKTAVPVDSVNITAFFAATVTDLVLQVSSDGVTFTNLEPVRRARVLPKLTMGAAAGRNRTMVEYEGAIPGDNRYLKVLWKGPAELDRVEIYHR